MRVIVVKQNRSGGLFFTTVPFGPLFYNTIILINISNTVIPNKP